MAVRNIYAEGGAMPEPKDGKDGEGTRGSREDPVREIEDAYFRGERVKAFKKGAGMDEPRPVETKPPEEKISLNIGELFRAQSDTVNSLMNKLTELVSNRPSVASDPYVVSIREQLAEVKAKLEGSNRDPLDVLTETSEKMDRLTQGLKKRLGLSEGLAVSGGDMGNLIELEKVRQESEDRRRTWEMDFEERKMQWSSDMEERRRQWDREQKRWEQEFGLKRTEFTEGQSMKRRAADSLEDIAGSYVESIDNERGAEGGVAGEAAGRAAGRAAATVPDSQRIARPKQFKCGTCGKMVDVPVNAAEVTCSGCSTVYDMVEADSAT